MQIPIVISIWLINVLVLGVALSLFEIILERNQGWASALSANGWGRKLFAGSVLARICEKPYLTPYHIFMFLLFVPALLFLEYVAVGFVGLTRRPDGLHAIAPSVRMIVTIAGSPWLALCFQVAVWLSLVAVEDFLWFALNWYYPGSLQDLMSGKVWWHTHWVNVGRLRVPRFYFSANLMAALLLVVILVLAMRVS